MEKDVLGKVIAAEREIQECIEAESVKAREWLERIKKEAEEELRGEREDVDGMVNEQMRIARKKAEDEAAGLVRDARNRAGRIEKLDDALLKKIIMRHLHKILPD